MMQQLAGVQSDAAASQDILFFWPPDLLKLLNATQVTVAYVFFSDLIVEHSHDNPNHLYATFSWGGPYES